MAKLDTLEQMRSFGEWMCENPYRISRSAQVLWWRLHTLSEMQGGVHEVVSEGPTLARLMGSSEKTFFTARAELEDIGLLICRRGVKGSPSKYELVRLYGKGGWINGRC